MHRPSLAAAGMRQPTVLVLLASHNGSEWIGEQLASILAQKGVNLQIVVRDDCSSDDTRSKLQPFLESAPVRLIPGDIPTGSAAQNYFALIRESAADGFDFIALADQDDVWHEDKLLRACGQLDASCAGYSSATLAVRPNGTSTVLKQSGRSTSSDFLFGGIGQGCTFVLTKSFYEQARRFLARNAPLTHAIHYHDWTLYALARSWGLRWVFDPTPAVRYRQHGRNDTGARDSFAAIGKRLHLIRSGWYARQLRAVAELCAAANRSNAVVSAWRDLLFSRHTWRRRLRIVGFCLSGGRRSPVDNAVVILAALSGWL